MSAAKVKLDVLAVKNPCPESWDAMSGDDAVRFCGLCRMNVYNLSAMTRAEAEHVVATREGRLCVRFYRRADGTVTTVDCAPQRFLAMRRAARQTLTAGAALLASLLTLVFGLGLFRFSGVDVSSWLQDTAIGKIAKAGGLMEPEVVMGEEMMMGEPAMDHVERMGGVEAPPIEMGDVAGE